MRTLSTKIAVGFAAAAAVTLTLSACSGTTEPAAEGAGSDLDLVNAGTLTVCISKNAYEPLYWNDGGTLTGFDVDAITAIAGELDLDVTFSEMAFDGLLPALTSGRCDVLRSGLYINDDRKAAADAIGYLQTGPALVVPVDGELTFEETDDLSGARVAVQAASANEKILQELSADFESRGMPGIEISSYPELPETMAALTNGRVDATMETDVAATQAAKTLGDDYAVAADLFAAETEFGMFLQKDSPLTDTVRDIAIQLTDDGTFETLAEEYALLPSRLVTP